MWSLLEQKPLSRLGKLSRARSHEAILELASAYSLDKNEIYFDRDPHMFTSILDYYRCYSVDIHISQCNDRKTEKIINPRHHAMCNVENTLNDCRTGKLHVQEGVCIIDFANELDFWMIKEVMIELCCNDKFVAR